MTNFTFEPELNRPTPRPVRYRDGFSAGCGLWFVRLIMLPHTLVGLGALSIAIGSTALFVGIFIAGTDFDGKVVKKDDTRRSKGSRYWYVTYTYDVNGQVYSSEVSVSEAAFGQVNQGDAMTVRALESMPDTGQWPRLPGYWPIEKLGGMWFFAGFWNGIMSIFLWMVYIRPWLQRRLIRIGIPTKGIVRQVSVQMNKGNQSYVIRYEYAVPATEDRPGQVLMGKLRSTVKGAQHARAGDVATVLFHPRNPRRSLLYAYSDYRAAADK